MKPLPNFFIIGAAKAGTSSLFEYLRQHPDIRTSPIKEPEYFRGEGPSLLRRGPGDSRDAPPEYTWEGYLELFAGAGSARAVGEASTTYLRGGAESAGRIHAAFPEARMIAILRQPADRAYSNFIHLRREGREPLASFSAALEAEPERLAAGWAPIWGFKTDGFYHDRLRAFYDLFGRIRMHVCIYEDWRDPQEMLKGIFGFLDVDNAFVADTARHYNVGGLHGRQWLGRPPPRGLRRALKSFTPKAARNWVWRQVERLREKDRIPPPPLEPAVRQRLTAEYRDDIEKTQQLIGRDLSHWLA